MKDIAELHGMVGAISEAIAGGDPLEMADPIYKRTYDLLCAMDALSGRLAESIAQWPDEKDPVRRAVAGSRAHMLKNVMDALTAMKTDTLVSAMIYIDSQRKEKAEQDARAKEMAENGCVVE